MFERILLPLDSSEFAEKALPHATTLAQRTGARLHLVLVHEVRPLGERVVTLGSELVEARQREAEEEYLEQVAVRVAKQTRSEPDRTLLVGNPATELAHFVAGRQRTLVVMCTHGHGGMGRAWMGSVADSLARHTTVPLLLVRATTADEPVAPPGFRRVLVALDGSAAGEAAARNAATLCAATGAGCTVIRVVLRPAHVIASRIPDTARLVHEKLEDETLRAEQYLRDLLQRMDDLPPATQTCVIAGYRVAETILRTAEADGADVVAVGTRGHGGAARLLLGSVADKVIRGSSVPVLVCPDPRGH